MPDTVLLYEFTPEKVSVSVGGDARIDSLLDLEVKINNRGPVAMVERIQIEIPTGAHGATAGNRLSANALPHPEYDKEGLAAWGIDVDEENGSLVTIEAKSKKPTKLETTLEFTLRGILVNDTPGIVPITVDEFAPAHIKATFQIDKEDVTGPVARFYVADAQGNELNPAVLYDLDERVWLKWLCTDQGESYSYGLHTEEGEVWEPKNWRRTDEFFNCADGTAGVRTDKLVETTTFALEVVKKRSVHQILYTKVRVKVPRISEDSFVKKYLSGQFISLNWVAVNAGKCVVEMDGRVLDRNAPTDTYADNYLVLLPPASGAHTATVRAYAQTGSAKTSKVFDPVSAEPPVTITTARGLTRLAITPNGKYALGLSQSSNQVTRINLTTNEVTTVTVGTSPNGIAITADSTRAFVVNYWDGNISVIDIESGTASTDRIDLRDKFGDITLTPDGKFALVYQTTGTMLILNVAEKRIQNTIPFSEYPVAIRTARTPAGDIGVVATAEGTLRFIDLATWTIEPNPTQVERNEWPSLAVTPDGRLAMVANYSTQSVTVIDIASRRVLPGAIRTSQGPTGIAITADGKLAFLHNTNGDLNVINLSDLKASALTIPLGFVPDSMAVSDSGNVVLIAPHIGYINDPGTVIKFTLLETD